MLFVLQLVVLTDFLRVLNILLTMHAILFQDSVPGVQYWPPSIVDELGARVLFWERGKPAGSLQRANFCSAHMVHDTLQPWRLRAVGSGRLGQLPVNLLTIMIIQILLVGKSTAYCILGVAQVHDWLIRLTCTTEPH